MRSAKLAACMLVVLLCTAGCPDDDERPLDAGGDANVPSDAALPSDASASDASVTPRAWLPRPGLARPPQGRLPDELKPPLH